MKPIVEHPAVQNDGALFPLSTCFKKSRLPKKDWFFFENRFDIEASHAHEESSIKNAYFSIKDWLLTKYALN